MEDLIKNYHIPSKIYFYKKEDDGYKVIEKSLQLSELTDWDRFDNIPIISEKNFNKGYDLINSPVLCVKKPINIQVLELSSKTPIDVANKFFKNTNLNLTVREEQIIDVYEPGIVINRPIKVYMNKVLFFKCKNLGGVDYDINNEDISEYRTIKVMYSRDLSFKNTFIEGFYGEKNYEFFENN